MVDGSPDGRFLAFKDWNRGRMEICRMSLAGDDVRNLSQHPSNDFWAGWR